MKRETRLEELAAFLRSRRAAIRPDQVGLPAAGRRRTPGLRREEVAQLASVSTTWYTWLEQGRDIRASASVLDAVANALRLNRDERQYLHALATEGGGTMAPLVDEETNAITPSLRHILDELRHCPVIISDRRCHIVGWNDAAEFVFLDFSKIPYAERNMIRLIFARKELRALAVNWEHFVGGFLAIFRAYYGQYVEDGWYERFLDEMRELNPRFEPLWQHSQVSSAPEVNIQFRHAKAGKMEFNLTSLQVHGNIDLRCSVYTPEQASNTESKLRRLMDVNQ